jgi:hypothetical protein
MECPQCQMEQLQLTIPYPLNAMECLQCQIEQLQLTISYPLNTIERPQCQIEQLQLTIPYPPNTIEYLQLLIYLIQPLDSILFYTILIVLLLKSPNNYGRINHFIRRSFHQAKNSFHRTGIESHINSYFINRYAFSFVQNAVTMHQ